MIRPLITLAVAAMLIYAPKPAIAQEVLTDDRVSSPVLGASPGADLPERAAALAQAVINVPTTPLTLSEAVLNGLENNTNLAVSRFSPSIREAQITTAKGPFDLIVTAGLSHARTDEQLTLVKEEAATAAVINPLTGTPITTSVEQPYKGVSRNYTADIGLSKLWATGTTTGIGFSTNRSSGGEVREYFSSVDFTLRQSLLKGLRPKVNLAAIRQAENSYLSSLYQLRSDVITTIANVERAYWNLALAYELLGVQTFSVELAEEQLDRTASFVEVGKLSPIEVTTAKAELASRRSDFIDALNNLELRAIDLLVLTEKDFGMGGEYTLPKPVEEARLPQVPGTHADSIEIAMNLRPDLYQAYLDLDNGELDVIRTRDGLLPRLDLAGTYSITGRGAQFDESVDVIEDQDFDRYSVGVDLEYPIPNRSARGQYKAAKVSLDQIDASINNLKQFIRADVLQARIDMSNRIAGVDAALASVNLEQEKLENETEKWKNGLSTSLDVIQSQRDLINSRNQLLTRITDALLGEIELYVQEGSLLEARGLGAAGGEELSGLPPMPPVPNRPAQ